MPQNRIVNRLLLIKFAFALLVAGGAASCANGRPAAHPATLKANATPATQFGTDQVPWRWWGAPGNAPSFAYVCDASGSMMEKMERLKQELSNAIEGLRPYQKFSITFFQNETPTFLDKDLILATPENKRKAEQFLANVSTNGSTDPIPGLDIALRQHPRILFLLTDGDFPDNDAVLREVHKLDPDHKVKIDTVAFIDSADRDVDFKKLLKQLADESGGTFKVVNVDMK